MRKTPEQKIAEAEAEMAALRRKVRMERVAGVREAVFLSRALTKWNNEFGASFEDENNVVFRAIDHLKSIADEPEPKL